MMSKTIASALIAAGLCFGAALQALAVEGADAERARLRTEREAVEATFKRKQAECEARFVVTSCVEDARREQREALARLRHREAELNDAERKERTAARRQEIEENAKRDRERQKEASVPAKGDALRKDAEPRVTVRPPPQARPSSRPASGSFGGGIFSERPVDEARSRAEFDARQRAIAEHRQQVEQRNLERAAKGKVVAPLPTPASLPASAP